MVEQLAGRGPAAEFVAHAAVGFDDGRAGVGHEAQHQFLGLDFEIEEATLGQIRSAAFEEFFQHGGGKDIAPAEPVPGVERVAAGGAEDERAGIGIRLPRGPQAFHPPAVFEFLLKRGGIEASVAPRDLLEVHIVLESEVVEGNQ